MKTTAFAGMVAMAALATPVQAMEHKTVIEHPAGQIAANYTAASRIEMQQVGMAGGAGRPSSQRCVWTVSLSVERDANVGGKLQAKRSMTRTNVLRGSAPGWCSERGSGIDRMVEARRDELRGAMMALVAQDRDIIVAEADNAHAKAREG